MVARSAAHGAHGLPHRVKLAFWTGGFLLGLLVLVGFWLFWPKETPLLVCTITDYDESLPLNAWARDDAESLAAVTTKNLRATVLDHNQTTSDLLRTALRKQLDGISPGGPGVRLVQGRVALIYLSGHGVTDEQNNPCLQLMDSASDTPTTVHLEDLFEDICQHPSLQRGTRIIVLLDASRVRSDWRQGMLYNNFNDRLQSLMQQGKWSQLIVFNSAGPGQVGWAAPELGGSVFGHFVKRALQGEADGGSTRGYVTLGELRTYLQSRVDGWVWRHRRERQTPQQLGGDGVDHLSLVHVAPSAQEPRTAEPAAAAIDRERLERVLSLWRRVELAIPNEVGSSLLTRHHPLARAAIQRRLMRLEALLLGGEAYRTDDFDREEPAVRQTIEQLETYSLSQHSLTLDTLPLRRLAGSADQSAGTSVFAAWRGARATTPPEPFTIPSTLSARQLVEDVWNQLASVDPQPQFDDLDQALEFLAAGAGIPEIAVDPHREIHFLQLINRYLDHRPHIEDAIGLALRAHDRANHAAAPQDERTHYAVWSAGNQADQKRREADDLLLVGSTADVEKAERLWETLLQDAAQPGSYAAVQLTTDTLASALELRDRVLADLPDLTRWLLEQHRRTSSLSSVESALPTELPAPEAIDQLIRDVRELSSTIEDATFDRGPVEKVEQVRQRCDSNWKLARQAWNQRVEQLKDRQAAQSGQTLREILACLETSLLSADDRAELYDRLTETWESESSDAFDESLPPLAEQDAFLHTVGSRRGASSSAPPASSESSSLAPATPSRGSSSGPATSSEIEHRHPALVMCDVNFPWPDRPPQPSSAQYIDQWMRQGRELKNRLNAATESWKHLTAETQALLAITPPRAPVDLRADLSRADLQSRAMAGILGSHIDGDLSVTPTQILRRLDWYFLSLWHAYRTIEDFWGPRPGEQTPSYFQTVGSGYINNVRAFGWETAASRQFMNQELAALLAERVESATTTARITCLGESGKTGQLMLHRGAPSEPITLETTPHQGLPSGTAALFLHEPGKIDRIKPANNAPDADVSADSAQPVRRRAVSTSADPDRWPLTLQSDDVPSGLEQLSATLFYRGHLANRELPVRESDPAEIIISKRPQYPPPRINISADAQPIETLIVILDCSGTMSTRMPGGTRWDVARDTLLRTLRNRPEGIRRFGLVVYGSQWENESVPFNDDIDWKPPPMRFDAASVQQIEERLRPLKPTRGFTPISKALLEAFQALTAEERSAVLLITDGNEEWYQPAQGEVEQTQQRVLSHQILKSVPVHVVMVGDEKAAPYLKALAQTSNGELIAVDNPTSLSQALLKPFEGPPFFVQSLRDPAAGRSPPHRLGSTWRHGSWNAGQIGPYEVSVVGRRHDSKQRILLEGGEWLKLKYDLSSQQMLFAPYDQDARPPGKEFLDPRDSQREFVVMPHLPPPDDRRGDQVSFWISVQARDPSAPDARLFSPRPKCIWAEIRPQRPPNPDGTRPTFYFFEPIFVPDLPVPVLRLDVPRWRKDTADAELAEIQLWFHPAEDVPPNVTLPMELDQQEFKPVDLERHEIRGVDRLRIEKRKASSKQPLSFVVTEDHAEQEALSPLRLQMTPEPDQVWRSFESERKRVTTTFVYTSPAALDDQRPELKITTRQKFTGGCIGSDEPLLVRVPERP